MMRAARIILCSAVCALGAFLTPIAANAASLDHFALDSYHAWKKPFTPPARSNIKLKKGLYVATIQGTFSYYSAINYVVPQSPWTILCGTPGAAPQFGSAGGSGKVGFDSEFIISRPWLPAPCNNAKLPIKWINFQVNAGKGVWLHPSVLGSPTAPTPTHTYSYALPVGGGHRASFRLFDIDTRDNYGSLKISISAATTANCTEFAAFGLASEAECVTTVTPKVKKHG